MTTRKPGGFLKLSADRQYLALPRQLQPRFLRRSLLPRRQVGAVAAALSRSAAVVDHPVGQEGVLP